MDTFPIHTFPLLNSTFFSFRQIKFQLSTEIRNQCLNRTSNFQLSRMWSICILILVIQNHSTKTFFLNQITISFTTLTCRTQTIRTFHTIVDILNDTFVHTHQIKYTNSITLMHGSNSASASNFDRITFCNGVYKTEYMSIQTKIQQYFGG